MVYKSRCGNCGHDNCHGISQQLVCDRDIQDTGNILKRIWNPWCRQYIPSDNLEYLEWCIENNGKKQLREWYSNFEKERLKNAQT